MSCLLGKRNLTTPSTLRGPAGWMNVKRLMSTGSSRPGWHRPAGRCSDAQVVPLQDARVGRRRSRRSRRRRPAADRAASSFTLMESGTPHSGCEDDVASCWRRTPPSGVSGLPTMIFAVMDDLALLEHPRHELGDVVPDVELAQVLGHPAPALHVDDQALHLGAEARAWRRGLLLAPPLRAARVRGVSMPVG